MKMPKFILMLLFLLATLAVQGALTVSRGGSDSNSVYTIALVAANSVGGPTNGVTAATAASIAATNAAYYATNGTGVFVGYTTNLHLGSYYAVEAFGSTATNAIDSDGIGAWTFNRYNPDGSLVGRNIKSIDFQFVRYHNHESAAQGNAILWGVGNVAGQEGAGGVNVPAQDNAVIVNGTQNTNNGVECTIVSGTYNRLDNGPLVAVNHTVILNGMWMKAKSDYTTVLGGSNVIAEGYGSILGGYDFTRTNAWEFFYGWKTNGISVRPTNGTITAEGNMRFKVGDAQSWSDLGITGFTNQTADGNVIRIGSTNSVSGSPEISFDAAGGSYSGKFGLDEISISFLGTPLFSINGTTGDGSFSSVSAAVAMTVGSGGSAPTITSGSGAPSASEPNGSLYMRTTGLLYVRTNSTWKAIQSSP